MPSIRNMRWFAALSLVVLVMVGVGCDRAYYATMEKFGLEKRDILIDRVEDARNAQEDAAEQFESALDAFRAVVKVDGGELEQRYDTMNAAYKASEAEAERVSKRIDEVQDVAEDLFDEWEDEIKLYTNRDLARESKQKLAETRTRYSQLMGAMRKVESRIDPVLAAFRDQVLFLKHNLNARAIAALEGEVASLSADVDQLVAAMRRSIQEADSFIQGMKAS